jgi:succinate-acetate transporter protein
MGRFLAVLLGFVAMAAGLILVIVSETFRTAFIQVVFGFIPPFLFFGGLIALVAGLSSIKDAQRIKKLGQETESK